MEAQSVKISLLKNNTGQIEGLPKNPRFIRDEKFAKLKKSLEDDPEMMQLREVIAYDNNGELVVICGNMRLRALKELGVKDVPVKVLPTDTPIAKLKAYTIKDNVPFGEHDWDVLANEWDTGELEEWGVDIPAIQDFSDANQEVDVDGLDGIMTIKLEYTEADYWKVKEALAQIAATPEDAVFKLLNLE